MLNNKDWGIFYDTKIMVSVAASLFGLEILFAIFIFGKYLVIRSQCQRVTMMIFYILTILDLVSRMAIMVSLNFKAFFATELLVLSVISLFFALMVGVAHAWILATLIIDLKTLQCKNLKDMEKVNKLRTLFRVTLISWIGIVCCAGIYFFFSRYYIYIMLGEGIMFIL